MTKARQKKQSPTVPSQDFDNEPSDDCRHPQHASVIRQNSLVISMSPRRLLVCSIGNPKPYIDTLHSAGHIVLSALAAAQSTSFVRSRAHGNGLIAPGPDWTLWQSTSLMNVSGVGLAAAWRQFVKDSAAFDREPQLVVVHDEMELPMGRVKSKTSASSAKGHNGLKSIKEHLGALQYTRIGVGIGRPASREPDVVSKYVLRKASPEEKVKLQGVYESIEGMLKEMIE